MIHSNGSFHKIIARFMWKRDDKKAQQRNTNNQKKKIIINETGFEKQRQHSEKATCHIISVWIQIFERNTFLSCIYIRSVKIKCIFKHVFVMEISRYGEPPFCSYTHFWRKPNIPIYQTYIVAFGELKFIPVDCLYILREQKKKNVISNDSFA